MKKILSILLIPALASSCGLYTSYQRPATDTEGLFRDAAGVVDSLKQAGAGNPTDTSGPIGTGRLSSGTDQPSYTGEADTLSLGDKPWQEIFTDPYLRRHIETALANNTDLQTARLRVEEAEAALMASRLSFLPSLTLAPEGTISRFDGGKATKTYTIPVAASWEIDAFGKLRSAKQRSKAAREQSEVYRQAVQTQVVASVANLYYTLVMLDRQYEISTRTAAYWKENVETMKAMKRAGMTTEDAVSQSEANYYSVEASVLTLSRQIHETENSLAVVLGEKPQALQRGRLEDWRQPAGLTTGVPLRLLAARPDVRSAELSLAQAFYTTQGARAAFYPSLVLGGSAGWTNNAGAYIANPGKFLLSAVASLTQPLFAKGANIAQLKIAKAQQEEALLAFRQTLLDAGAEVNNALVQCQMARGRIDLDVKQIAALESAVKSTQLLMKHGNTTYLEVLVAQENLLQSQLTWVADQVDEIQGVISLYQALGGGYRPDVEPADEPLTAANPIHELKNERKL